MAALSCAVCGLFVTMKLMDAKAHGWTCKTVPSGPSLQEIWTCPACQTQNGAAA